MEIESSASENRFSHLLKPIRDLAENWNIDIAKDLEDYLSELEHITFEFDGVGKTLNFAEAALLIQGSTCVYSKKVEYLYTLIYKTLELIVEKKKQKFQKQDSSIRDDGKDADIFDDDNIDMTALDDMLEEATNIDLDEGPDVNMQDNDRQSLLRRQSALNDYANRAVASLSLTLGRDLADPNKSDFKLNSCSMSATGALLLGQGLDLLGTSDNWFARDFAAASVPQIRIDGIAEDNGDNHVNMAVDGIDIDNNIEANGDIGDNIEPEAAHFNENGADHEQNGAVPENVDKKAEKAKQKRRQTLMNPWECLDPHDPSDIAEKPFKKGKTYKIPPAPSKIKEKINSLPTLMPDLHIITSPDQIAFSSNYFVKPFHPEFQYLYDKEIQRRIATQKQQKKAKMLQELAENGIYNEDEQEELESVQNLMPYVDNEANMEDDDDMLPIALEPQLNDNEETLTALQSHEQRSRDDGVGMTYEDLCKAHIEQYTSAAEQYFQQTALSKRVAEWNSKLTPLLQEQDARPSFDIKHYCQTLLSGFPEKKSNNKVVQERAEIVFAATEPYDACRKFVAMLQLANSGNIEIVADKTRTGHDNISCKLLSDKLREDAFDEYDFTGEKGDSTNGSADLRQESREEPSDNGEEDEEEVVIKKKSASKSKRVPKKPATNSSKSKKSSRKKNDEDKENIFNGSRPLEVSEY